MALLGSLATGASGVKTQGKSMQVIGNNIANVNTFGFKRNNVAVSYTHLTLPTICSV